MPQLNRESATTQNNRESTKSKENKKKPTTANCNVIDWSCLFFKWGIFLVLLSPLDMIIRYSLLLLMLLRRLWRRLLLTLSLCVISLAAELDTCSRLCKCVPLCALFSLFLHFVRSIYSCHFV